MRINYAFKAIAKSLVLSVLVQFSLVAPISSAKADVLSSTTTRTTLINPAGGNDAGSSSCANDAVVVGFRWSGGTSTSSPYSIYCRALNADGSIPNTPHTTSNTTAYTVYVNASAANTEWCPDGTVATGVRHRGWADFALVCNTPPDLNSTDSYSNIVTTPTDNLCAVGSLLVGMGKYTGAWLDSLYGVCAPFARYALTYNMNGGTGTAPATFTQSGNTFLTTLPDGSGFSKSGFTFAGWSTAAAGQATPLLPGATYSPGAATTLYAQWGSTITYDANSATSGSVPSPTLRSYNSGNTTLATNTGNLARTNFSFGGWNTAADGTGTSYAAGLTTYAVNGDKTLYAQWNSTITYNGNGNTSGTAPTATTATKTSAGTTLQTAGTLVKTGFAFAGWSETTTVGAGTVFAGGATNFQASGNTTLYAMWNSTPTTPDLLTSSDTGNSSTDNQTGDSTPEFSTSNLVVNGSVTIQLLNSSNVMVGSCTFVATSSSGSCIVSSVPSGTYSAKALQAVGTSTLTSSSLANVIVDITGPTAAITVTTGTTISFTTSNTAQVSSGEIGSVYLVNSTVNVVDESSITTAATNLWKKITISTAGAQTNAALSGLLGGTLKAYAVDQFGNFGAISTNSILLYSIPGAPTNIVATPGVGPMGPKIDLTWTAPTDNGGGITYYVVEYSIDNGTTWKTFLNKSYGSGTSFSVYPVVYGQDYIYRLTAKNSAGTSTVSTISNIANVTLPTCNPTLSPNGKTLIFPVGACTYTIPSGVTSYRVDAYGAGGGKSSQFSNSGGGYVAGILSVTAGNTIYIYVGDKGSDSSSDLGSYVGRGGFNGGGDGGFGGNYLGGGGGGATDIRTSSALNSRLVVAGGAGGNANGSGNSCCTSIGTGAMGGGTTGKQNVFSDGSSGGGGSQLAGGGGSGTGTAGALGIGGNGASTIASTTTSFGGGGGGGGYYGGGGGAGASTAWPTGGGGASSYVSNSAFTSSTNTQGDNCGRGLLALTLPGFTPQAPAPIPCGYSTETTPPVIASQTVSTDGLTITLTYTDANNMSAGFVDPSLFTVNSDGSVISVSNVSASGKTLILTLARNLKPGSVTTISYVDATIDNDLFVAQDIFGNDSANFTNLPIVTTGITVATPTAVTLVAASDTGSSNSDKNTNDNTPTFSASTLVIGATVVFTATGTAGSTTCTITATATTDTCTFATLADDTYSVVVKQTNGTKTSANSTALSGVSIVTTAPTVTITSTSLTNNGTYAATTAATLTLTFNRNVTGLTTARLTTTGSNWTVNSLTGSNATYTLTITPNQTSGAEGIFTAKVNAGVATDIYGNTNAISATWTTSWVAKVTFNSNSGGTAPAALTQPSSTGAINLPGVGSMVKTGNTFGGWSTTLNGTAISGTTYTPTANVTLYAVWSPSVFVVTYDANGGTGSAARTSDNYTYGTTALTLPAVGTLAKTGYTFIGWNTLTTSTTALASSYTPAATVTLYAVWQANTYNITFDKNSSSATGTMSALSITAGTAKALTAIGYTLTGFSFGNWNTAANGSGTSYTNAQSVTLYSATTLFAQWIIRAPGVPTAISATAGNGQATVTVTGAAASLTVGAAASFTVTAYSGSTAVGTCTITSPATSCVVSGLSNGSAYTFKATATNATGTSAASATSTAVTPAGYVVTFNANSGTVTPASSTFNAGTPLILPLPTRSGYNFSGWYGEVGLTTYIGSDGGSYSPSSAVTLYAKWSGINYTITYSGNGNTGGSAPSTGTYANGGTVYTVSSNSGSLTKTGYTFSGWNTKPDGTGTDFVSPNTYSVASDVTLYAKWVPETYTVTYSANGATGAPSKTSDSYTFGSAGLTLPTINTMAKTGYTFMGWIKSGDTSTVTAPYIPTANVTLNAYWIGETYSVDFNTNGGTGSINGASYQNGATGITLPNGSTLSRTGYDFAGWVTSANGTSVVTSPYTTSANVTLYAKWVIKSVTVTYSAGVINGTAPTVSLPSNTSSTYGAQFQLGNTDSITAMSGTSYAFVGWSDSSTFFSAGANYPIGLSNVVFTAQWVAIYTLHYNLNGGSGTVDPDATYISGTVKTTPANDPTRTGYDFAGWEDQSGLVTQRNSSYTILDGHYILSAKWNIQTKKVTYSAGTGSGSVPADTTVSYGSIATLATGSGITAPAQSIFDGWLIGGVKYGAGSTLLLTTDLNAEAQWKNNYFSIYFDTNGGSANPAALNGATGSSQTLPSNPTRNGYVFAGWNAGGTVLATTTTSATIGATSATYLATWTLASPGVPTINSVAVSDGSASISVAADANGGLPASYTITSNPGGLTCTVVAPATSCTIAPLNNGTSYAFTATATNSSGTSGASNQSNAVTPAGKPSVVSGVTAIASNSQATVSFNPPSNNGGASIQSYTVTASPGSATCTVNAPSTSCAVTGLSNGTTYSFTVTANNGAGISNASAQSNFVTPATVPDAPTSISPSSSTPGAASVAFTAPGNNGGASITSYTVTATPVGGGATVTASGASSPISVAGLTNGVAYTFTATASNTVGNSLASASSSSLTTQAPASAPTTITAVANNAAATISFSGTQANGATITGYTVSAYQNGISTGLTCTVSTSSTSGSCSISGLANGVAYTFKATTDSTANGTSVTSANSIATSAVTPAAAPSAPQINSPVAGDNKITVSWTPGNSNGSLVTGYTVTAYDQNGNAITPAITCSATVGTNSCDLTGFGIGTNYTFKVVANASPASSLPSSLSSAENMNSVPNAPGSPAVTVGNASATIALPTDPSSNGYPITSYLATATPGGATCTVVLPASSCTINNLSNGTQYSFALAAINQLGSSSSSTSATGTPSTTPGAPSNVVAATGDSEATITFVAPTNNGGSAITHYTVTASPGGATATSATSPIQINGLTNGVAYTFTVIASNANGDGPSSAPSEPATPRTNVAPTVAASLPPSGTSQVGQVLTSATTFSGNPQPTFSYQWQICSNPSDLQTCADISSANSSTYTVVAADLGSYLRVITTATNGIQPDVTDESPMTTAITAAPSSGGGGGGGGSSASITPTSPVTPTVPVCDSACQAANNAATAEKAASDAAKSASDAAAKAAADAAALSAAKQAVVTQQALAAQAAQAAAKAQAAQAAATAKAQAAQAAANAAAQRAAAVTAAANAKPSANSSSAKAAVAAAQAQATALAAKAEVAVKSASTAAATAVVAVAAATAAQSQLAIQITNIKVIASVATTSAAVAKEAVSTAKAQQAAAKAAQSNAAQIASVARAAAEKAAADAATADAAKAAADAAAVKAAADAVAKQKVAENAATDKAAADKAAADAATKLVEAAQSAAKAAEAVTKATTSEEKVAAQAALEVATAKVDKAQDVVEAATQVVETKAAVLATAAAAADKALDHAEAKSNEAEKAAETVAVKQATVAAAKEVLASVAQQVTVAKQAVVTATTNVAKAVAVAAKVSSSSSQGSAKGKAASTAKVTINNLKPGQRIKVTVNKK